MKRALNPDGMILTSSGDMWQGSADSNITRGRLVTAAMNELNFDAMVLGNHEFDWGAETIRTNQALAEFPFLGANIIDKASDEIADFVLPHTMIERQGVKIGIIGTIGANLESSIMPSMIAPFDLRAVDSYIASSATALHEQGAHLTILLNHDGSISDNALNYVDLVFNGHAHAKQMEMRSGVPILQARDNGKSVAYARLNYDIDRDNLTVTDYGIDDYIINLNLSEDVAMATIYQAYYEDEIRAIKEEVLGTATSKFERPQLGELAVTEMLKFGESYGAVAAFHNTGGIRSSVNAGTVTFGDVYKALPFDNDLIVLELTGTQLKQWLNNYAYVAGIDDYGYFEHNGQAINNATVYTVITISYLSEQTRYYPHDVSSEINTFEYPRNLVASKWRTSGELSPYNY